MTPVRAFNAVADADPTAPVAVVVPGLILGFRAVVLLLEKSAAARTVVAIVGSRLTALDAAGVGAALAVPGVAVGLMAVLA